MEKDFPISELRVIHMTTCHRDEATGKFRSNMHPSAYMMHESQVETFKIAIILLHHEVGNPHHKDEEGKPKSLPLNNLWQLEVYKIDLQSEARWWSSPTNHLSTDGAKLNSLTSRERLWAHPDLLASEREAEEWEEKYD